MNKNTEKVMISLPREFLNKADEFADENLMTRSELIRNALRSYMSNPIKNKVNNKVRNAGY